MSTSSKVLQDAKAACQDAVNAAADLGRVAKALSEALQYVANIEARVERLERMMVSSRTGEGEIGRGDQSWLVTSRAEMRSHVDTNTAAGMLDRTPQTLRKWACYEVGPLRPIRISGRLAWAVADIRRLLSNGKS